MAAPDIPQPAKAPAVAQKCTSFQIPGFFASPASELPEEKPRRRPVPQLTFFASMDLEEDVKEQLLICNLGCCTIFNDRIGPNDDLIDAVRRNMIVVSLLQAEAP